MLTVRRRPNGIPALVNVFEDFFNRSFTERFLEEGNSFTPSVNISETEKEFKLEFAVPGFEKKDFNLEIEKDYIKVSGKKEVSEEVKEKNYTRKEFSYGSFERIFSLPENVEVEKIEALYEGGILHLTLPKKDVKQTSGSKRIEIK
jgi:HSP20 family protein